MQAAWYICYQTEDQHSYINFQDNNVANTDSPMSHITKALMMMLMITTYLAFDNYSIYLSAETKLIQHTCNLSVNKMHILFL